MIKKIFFLFILFYSVVFAKEFKVSYDPDYAPFSYSIEDKPYGLLIDIWKLWAKKNHHKIIFVKAKSWNNAIDLAKQQKVDFFLGTNPYELWMQSSITYYKTKTAFFFLQHTANHLAKIGIIGSDYYKFLKQKLPHTKIISYDTYEELVNALLQNDVNSIYDDALAIRYFAIKHGYYHLLTSSFILNEISNVKAISAKKSNVEIFSQGFKRLTLEELENIERKWIEDKSQRYYNNGNFLQKKRFFFIYNPHNKPIEFQNENKKYSGIVADLLSLISKKTSIEFVPKTTKHFSQALKNFYHDQSIEMISAIEQSNPLAKKLLLTKKDLISYSGVIVAKKSQITKDIKKIGIVDNSLVNYLQKQNYQIKYYKNFSSLVMALENNDVDAIATDTIHARYLIDVELNKLFEIKKILPFEYHIKIGFKPSVQKEVIAFIDEALSLISAKEKSDIYYKWMSVRIQKETNYTLLSWIVIIAGIIIGIFFLINKRLNALVLQRTRELQELNENLEIKVEERTKELKEINKKMQDNIRYAALIQNAILPSMQEFSSFFEEYFIIWEPKDIVGGDIYFFEVIENNEAYLFVIDCTGHGVSGAFLTMLLKAIEEQLLSSLNEIKRTPAIILEEINTILRRLLPQQKETNVGLDAGVIYINKTTQTLTYAGANIPLYYVEENSIKILKPNKISLGYTTTKRQKEFIEYLVPFNNAMRFYITTDGYIDQNGGAKGFPLGKKQFCKIIESSKDKSLKEQKEVFKSYLKAYQKDEERNDDITVIGFKI